MGWPESKPIRAGLKLDDPNQTLLPDHLLPLSLPASPPQPNPDRRYGPGKPSSPPSPPTGPAAMGAGGDPEKLPAAASPASLLLELSASDDLPAFKRAVEEDDLPLDIPAPWYCRSPGRRTMGFEQRIPLMIAALYGSPSVLAYILSTRPAEASHRSSSDGATPLHRAASGGSSSSLGIVKTLIDAAANVDAPILPGAIQCGQAERVEL